jgi:S-DNA-T family DNA segregation ATPase FtsK/SpoIIIE
MPSSRSASATAPPASAPSGTARPVAGAPLRVALPTPPSSRDPHPFPTVATVAPVLVSLAMWAATKSPFALMFAAFGPVMAIGGYLDAGLGGRRRYRAAMKRFRADQESAAAAVVRAHEGERRRRWTEHPSAASIVEAGRTDARWRMPAETACLVSIGAGPGASRLVVDGGAASGGSDDEADEALRRSAVEIDDVPVLIDARRGIGVVGPTALGRAVARSLVVQLAHAIGPDVLRIVALPDTGWESLSALPHAIRRPGTAAAEPRGAARVTLAVEERDASATGAPQSADLHIVVAPSIHDLPATVHEIVECRTPGRVVRRRADAPDETEAVPEPVSIPDASRFSAAMAADAVALGLSPRSSEPPTRLGFGELPHARIESGPGLPVPIGASIGGPFVVDLVTDGPHAVIGGTTGSGKSELLITWTLALAAATPPDRLSLLLFDFKGGATFGDVVDLPHVVGLVTDLDEAAADRALASLRAELRQRERILHAVGVRDIRDAPSGSLARLVIVVDEFAAMIESFPDLHGVFVDLAARGRSLGVHLVLCTQRPATAVRDGVLANCDIRISLRVNNAGDSIAVVGVPDAASLPSTRPGRVVATLGGREPVVAQIAEAVAADVAGVRRSSGGSAARRPWLDPLPARIPLDGLAPSDDGFVLGLLDLPAEQSQPTAVYRPSADGHLLVLGSSGRGTSTLLGVLDAQRPVGWTVLHIPLDLEAAWDAVAEIAARTRAPDATASSDRLLVLIDDLDILFARWGDEYGRAARSDLVEVLRSGPVAGIHLVLTAHRATADVLALADLVGSTVRLGSSSKHEHVLSGADSATYRPDRRPGSGVWRGHELQVAWVDRVVDDHGSAPPPPVRLGSGLTMVVSRRPADRARWARSQGGSDVVLLGAAGQGTLRVDDVSSGPRPTVVVGDVDAWQQQWALLTALRTSATVILEDAGPNEFRSLTRQTGLPPWIAPGAGRAWIVRPDRPVRRARFEAPPVGDRSPRRGRSSLEGAVDARPGGTR